MEKHISYSENYKCGACNFFLLIEQLTTGLTPIREDNIKTRDYSVTKVTWD